MRLARGILLLLKILFSLKTTTTKKIEIFYYTGRNHNGLKKIRYFLIIGGK